MLNAPRGICHFKPLLIGFIFFATVAAPQTQTQTQVPASSLQTPTSENHTRVVYVAVLDTKGSPMTDLKSEDFSILEGNAPQQIVGISPTSDSHIVLGAMIDLSGSTRGDTARHEKLNALLRFLAGAVGTSEEAFITGFAMSSRRLTGITASTNELWSGLKEVDEANPYGPTALYDSLLSTVDSLPPEIQGRKALIVVSDFGDNSSRHSLEKTIFSLQLSGTSVFPLLDIAKGQESTKATKMGIKVAQQMAEETGGEAYIIGTVREMESALRHIQLVLRNSYGVKYDATVQPKKDGSVPLKIQLHRKDVQLLYTRQRPPATP